MSSPSRRDGSFALKDDEDGPGMIVQLISAAVPDLESCDQEPIQTPGAIQPHGVLIVAEAINLRVTHVSANFELSTGITCESAIGSLLVDLIGTVGMSQVSSALASEHYSPANVLTLQLPFNRNPGRNVVVHSHEGHVFLELEPASFSNQGHLVARVQSIMAALRQFNSVDELCDGVVKALRALTGYDRVMVYRFDPTGNGEVIAEDRRLDIEPYLKLRYPASDIPNQARQLYLKQRVRVVVDAAYEAVPILTDVEQSNTLLDMSYCGLRSVSPIHIEYLRNMGVRATLTISLIRDKELWGLIVCHHLTPYVVPADVKALCDLLGQLVMLLINGATEREELEGAVERQQTLTLIKHSIERSESVSEALFESAKSLLNLVVAAGAAIRLNGRLHTFGMTPSIENIDAIMKDLGHIANYDIVVLESLGAKLPHYIALAATASGVLFLPILNNPGDAILWFRPELPQTVIWGGDPTKSVQVSLDRERLSPRKSFAAWRELLRGTSAPWTKAEQRAAHDLRRVVTSGMLRHAELRLVRMSKDEESIRAGAQAKIDHAKSVFFSNVSHEFRTPLTLMLAPLEDALTDPSPPALSPPQRKRIEIAHRNSLRLLRLVNTLLDFSRIESGGVTTEL